MSNPFISILNSLLPEPQASLLNGILFGIRASMQAHFYQALVDTGTLHIIALSGMNISILTNLIAQATLPAGRRIGSLLSICSIILFVWFVGASPSLIRAAIMGNVSLLAVYFGRQNWGLLSLLFAAGIMLLYDFSLVKNLSFQLSFLATLGIILANRKVERQYKKGALNQFIFWFKENLKLTFSAQLFTLPIILYNFHRISLVAPLANIAIEWVIQPIMILGFISAIAGWLFLPLGSIFAWITWVPLTYLISTVELFAKIPFVSVQF